LLTLPVCCNAFAPFLDVNLLVGLADGTFLEVCPGGGTFTHLLQVGPENEGTLGLHFFAASVRPDFLKEDLRLFEGWEIPSRKKVATMVIQTQTWQTQKNAMKSQALRGNATAMSDGPSRRRRRVFVLEVNCDFVVFRDSGTGIHVPKSSAWRVTVNVFLRKPAEHQIPVCPKVRETVAQEGEGALGLKNITLTSNFLLCEYGVRGMPPYSDWDFRDQMQEIGEWGFDTFSALLPSRYGHCEAVDRNRKCEWESQSKVTFAPEQCPRWDFGDPRVSEADRTQSLWTPDGDGYGGTLRKRLALPSPESASREFKHVKGRGTCPNMPLELPTSFSPAIVTAEKSSLPSFTFATSQYRLDDFKMRFGKLEWPCPYFLERQVCRFLYFSVIDEVETLIH